jgi:hypothetical protein
MEENHPKYFKIVSYHADIVASTPFIMYICIK